MTFKELIEKELNINAKIDFEEASERIKGLKEKTFNNVKSLWKKAQGKKKGNNGKIPKSTTNPPQTQEISFIDDPDELLHSVSIRELNKANPDPRWASILISVRKENIGKSIKEGNIQSKFKSMNIKDIVQIISSQKEKNTSQKPELKEHS